VRFFIEFHSVAEAEASGDQLESAGSHG
jgi:hypothetical protein